MKRFTLQNAALVLIAGLFLFASADLASAKGGGHSGHGSHMSGKMHKNSNHKNHKRDWNRQRRFWDYRYGYSYPCFEASYLPVCETTAPVCEASYVPACETILPTCDFGSDYGYRYHKHFRNHRRGHGHGRHSGGHGRK